ncbi:MAG: hypothetical protein M1830_008383 [Pleopsidium flavum]|nr:MAG: hypothetical protein M1830_008383 [Pleopsidium flavum]
MSPESAPPPSPEKPSFTQRQAIEFTRDLLGVLNNPQRSQELASLVELPSGDDSDLVEIEGDDSRSIAASSSTPGNENQSGQSSGTMSRSSSQQPQPITQPKAVKSQQWQGCASFFCQQFRPLGDHRNRCTGVLKDCVTCGVHVCQDCLVAHPPCSCTYCAESYNCPNCYRKLGIGVCRKSIEALERRKKVREAEVAMLTEMLSRRLSDEIAGQLGEFFAGLEMFGVENDESGHVEAL